MNVVTSLANDVGSHPGIGAAAFFLRNLPSRPPEPDCVSGSLLDDASCGMVWVWT